MKNRLFALTLSLLLTFGCFGCGGATEEAPAENQKAEEQLEEPETDERGIAGSNYTDICNMMTAMGFPDYEVNYIADENLYLVPYCTVEDAYSYAYGISFIEGGEIVDASFSIANLSLYENEQFLKDTTSFFIVGTAFSYDEADNEKLMAWINENVYTLEDVEIVIGDAKYSMYTTVQDSGLATARSLYIEKAN